MEIWLQQQASNVLTALTHAQALFGAGSSPETPHDPQTQQ
jgi:hypothetical protein